ncbi:MAG: ATP-binding cassette domain-containing protein [Candidatus Limnocylindrales bacterium]|jgi:ABC-2 type transport system ATP-binding protein
MTLAIETAGLTKSYGRRRGIIDLDLEVREGEVFGSVGPNGAGKTTTIRLLLGLIRASAGTASVWCRDAWADAPTIHRRVAYVGSDPGYLGELTAGEQLDYLARVRGLPQGVWRALAERLELDPTVQIRKLSRGNRQKIGVVPAFMGAVPTCYRADLHLRHGDRRRDDPARSDYPRWPNCRGAGGRDAARDVSG